MIIPGLCLGPEIDDQVLDDRVVVERLKDHPVPDPGRASPTGPAIDGHNAAGALTPITHESPKGRWIFDVGVQIKECAHDGQGFGQWDLIISIEGCPFTGIKTENG